jgi:RecA-family ATPase
MADPVPFRLTSPDVPADVDEQTAFDGHEPYTPTYCDFEAWEEHGEPPRRSWAIDGWLGMGHVTLLSAKGGMGKSILALQMATALGLGLDFVGKVHQPRTVLAWYGEDEDEELWRRQRAVSRKVGRPMSDLRDRVFMESMATEDCTLVAKVHGAAEMIRTHMLTTLREQIGDLKAEVVILDNIARLFAGNENDRYEVTAFMSALAWAAAPMHCAVLLVGHIAKAQGSEYSGSAAWENAARARLWFTDHPPDKETDRDEPEDDLRYLAKRKVNYTSRDLCTLRYVDDAYDVVQPEDPTGIVASIKRKNAERRVLDAMQKLIGMGLAPTEGRSSPAFLPKLATQYNLADGFTPAELERGMRALMADGTIKRAQIGVYANRSPKYGLVSVEEP